jgi:hypothetical protein
MRTINQDDTNRHKSDDLMAQLNATTGDRDLDPDNWKEVVMCPITRRPCEGDLAYLCPEYGCARKGGLSPRSNENF